MPRRAVAYVVLDGITSHIIVYQVFSWTPFFELYLFLNLFRKRTAAVLYSVHNGGLSKLGNRLTGRHFELVWRRHLQEVIFCLL